MVLLLPSLTTLSGKNSVTGKDEVYAFKNKLEKNGINVTIRREMGRDIDGACGQLRNKYMEDVDESNGDY